MEPENVERIRALQNDPELQKEIDKALAKIPQREADLARFYIEQGFSGTVKAADRAGYIPKDRGTKDKKKKEARDKKLGIQTAKTLKRPEVQELISLLTRQLNERTYVNIDWWLRSCKELHDKCCQVVPVMIRDADGNLVESGEYKFDSAGAGKALDMIGKHLGAYAEVKHTINADGLLKEVLETISGRTTGIPNPKNNG